MEPTHVVRVEPNVPALEITRCADQRHVVFRPDLRIADGDAQLWSELFGPLRRATNGSKLPVLAIRVAVEFMLELLHTESSWTPLTQIRIDFSHLREKYADHGFPWDTRRTENDDKDPLVHFRSRLSNIYSASNTPTIYLSSNDCRVVWRIPPCIRVYCKNEPEQPRTMFSRYFFMPRDKRSYRSFLIDALQREVRACTDDQKVEFYLLGRQGRTTFSLLPEVSSSVSRDPAIQQSFEQFFSSWFFFLTEDKKNVADNILDAAFGVSSITYEALEYMEAHPVVQGVLMVRWSNAKTIESSHLFVDYWHKTDKFCYRYYRNAHLGLTGLEHAAGTVEIPGLYSYLVFYGEVLRHLLARNREGFGFARTPTILLVPPPAVTP